MRNVIGSVLRDRLSLVGAQTPVQALLLSALVALLAALDAFRYPAVGIEDRMVRLLSTQGNPPSQVILVDGLPADPEQQLRVLQELAGAGAVLVAWVGPAVPQLSRWQGAVPLLVAEPGPQPTLGPDADRNVHVAAPHVATSEYGVHRHQDLAAPGPVAGPRTLEATALALLGRTADAPTHYLVNFRLPRGQFGRFDAGELLAGHVLPAMIAGKVVLVAGNERYARPRYEVPTSPLYGAVSQLEFHAYALDTLLAGRTPRRPDTVPLFALVLCTGLFTALLALFLIDRLGFWLLPVAGSVVLLLWLAAFTWAGVYLPLLAMLLTVLGVTAQYRLQVARSRARIVQNLLMQTARRAQDRLLTDGDAPEEEWNRIIVMVSQMLNLERCIFLVARPDDHYVREVAALRCSLDDICEQRRDYQRAPYTEALEARSPILLESRLFLSDPEGAPKDQQFMMPILLEGELQGFWCLTLDPGRFAGLDSLERELQPFAEQIAQRMYHVAYQQRMQEAGESPETYERKREEFFPELRLRAMITLLEARLTRYENVFSGLTTATIVYDLFGRVQHANRRMLDLLGSAGIHPYQMTMLELLTSLASMPTVEARNELRHVVVDRTSVALPDYVHIGKGTYQMLLSPVLPAGEREDETATAAASVGGRAVLFELVDASNMETRFLGRDHVLGLVVENLRSHSTALLMIRRLLGSEQLPAERRAQALKRFDETVKLLLEDVDQASDALTQPASAGEHRTISLHAGRFLQDRIARLQGSPEGSDLQVDLAQPSLPVFALAAADVLAEGVDGILELLAEDTQQPRRLTVRVMDTGQMVRIHFENRGYGIPEAHLARYLYEGTAQVSREFQRIRDLARVVEDWGGLLLASSEVGRGYHFILALQKVTGSRQR